MKVKEKRIEKNLKQSELAEKIGIDVPSMSRIEQYKCLPIPQTMDKLVKALECEVEDIYEPHEIYVKPRAQRKASTEQEIYKITVRLPKNARKEIKDALKVCGYKDVTYWIWRCYERLLNQKEILVKQRERYERENNKKSEVKDENTRNCT